MQESTRKSTQDTPTPGDTGEPGSIFAALVDIISLPVSVPWNLRIAIEAFLITYVSIFVVQYIGVPEAGLVGVALASAAIVPRFNTILAINRQRIWAEPGSGRRVNIDSTISAMSVFTAMFLAFLIVAILTDHAALQQHFGFILKQTQFESGQVLSPERFALGSAVLIHNMSVLLSFFLLSFLYRSLGAMIALGWNASVWAITLTLLAGEGIARAENPVLYTLTIIVAIMPHLVVEAAAYLVGSLCAIFLSRGITLYSISNPLLKRVLAAVLVLAIASVVLIIFGALLESNYAPRMLGLAY